MYVLILTSGREMYTLNIFVHITTQHRGETSLRSEFLFFCSLKMGRRSSDTEEETRSRRKKKHRRRSSSSSSSDSRTYSRKKSGRKSRSRSRSRDLQSRSHPYEKRCVCNLLSTAGVYKSSYKMLESHVGSVLG